MKGLNEKYAIVQLYIMLIQPLPHINKVFSLLIQQEHQHIIHVADDKLIALMKKCVNKPRNADVSLKYHYMGRRKWTKICTHFHTELPTPPAY